MKELKTMVIQMGYSTAERFETPEEKKARRKRVSEEKCKMWNESSGNLHEQDGYSCDLCKNKGYTVVSREYLEGYEEVMRPCKCTKVRDAIVRMKRSGLEPIIKKYTFDKYIVSDGWQKTMKDTARSYAENPRGRWLFLGGTCGSGKSHLCTAAAIHLLKQGNSVKYMQWREEAVMLKSLVNSEEYQAKIKEYKDCDVLYIDDLFKTGKTDFGGVQRPTAADINLAFEILNFRIVNQKITIISTEYTLSELVDVDEGIAGRIAEKCEDALLNIGRDKKKDYRLRNITTI